MKKSLTVSAFLITSFGVNAECKAPSETVNYLPLDTVATYCFEAPIDKVAGSMSTLKVELPKDKHNTLLVSPLNKGVFTNLIVDLKNGERKELHFLTLEQAKVETVILVDAQGKSE
ncbi:hypothetical protein DDN26_14650 [Vibrio cholerae]|nr:hypothetical protein [Vibrio cholerae]